MEENYRLKRYRKCLVTRCKISCCGICKKKIKSFHKLPSKNVQLRKKWLDYCGRLDLNNSSGDSYFLCNLHFSKSKFRAKGKYLKKYADPDIYSDFGCPHQISKVLVTITGRNSKFSVFKIKSNISLSICKYFK